MSGYFNLPNICFDHPWFTPERMWRVAWIGRHAYVKDNCVVKRSQLSKPLSVLSTEWKCTIKVVRNTLEMLEALGIIKVTFARIKGRMQTVITYLFSAHYDDSVLEKGTENTQGKLREKNGHGKGTEKSNVNNDFSGLEGTEWARKGHGKGTSIKTEERRQKEEDICRKPASDERPKFGFPDLDEVLHAEPGAVKSESAPKRSSRAKRRSAEEIGYTPEFEAIWEACPDAAQRGSKEAPFKVWQKLSPEVREKVRAAIPMWCDRVRGREARFIEAAATWFSQKRWQTEKPKPVKAEARARNWAEADA